MKTKPKMPKAKWISGKGKRLAEIYKAKDGWRWRLWARNGRIVAESGEAYRSKWKCTDMVIDISCGFGCSFVLDGKQLPDE